MLRALTANLVAHERIETTEAKAKELRRVAERMITRARRLGPVAYTPHDKLTLADRARRQAAQRQMARFLRRFAVVGQGDAQKKIDLVEKVFVDLAQRFKDRSGGYTRIMKLGRRRGDNAPMTLIEFVGEPEAVEGGAKPAKSAQGAEPTKAEAKPKQASTKDKPAAKAEDAAKTESKAKADEPKAEAGAKPKAEPKPEAGAKPAEEPQAKAEAKPKAKAQSKAAGASQSKSEAADGPAKKAPAKKTDKDA